MAITRGISWDYDGSLAHQKFLDAITEGIVAANLEKLSSLKKENDKYLKTELFVGSNRQSIFDDKVNSGTNKNGACYPMKFREL